MPILKGLYGAVMEEPSWNERVALLGAVGRGLGRAAIHDLIIDPLTIARMNHMSRARTTAQVGANALSTTVTAPSSTDLRLLPDLHVADHQLARVA